MSKEFIDTVIHDHTLEAPSGETWTAYYFEPTFDAVAWHWVALTNDDNMDGFADGRIAITQGTGPYKDLLAIFGDKSRVEKGRKISVYIKGEKQ